MGYWAISKAAHGDESTQRDYPDANFVKAFNSVGNALMVNPVLKGGNEWADAYRVLR